MSACAWEYWWKTAGLYSRDGRMFGSLCLWEGDAQKRNLWKDEVAASVNVIKMIKQQEAGGFPMEKQLPSPESALLPFRDFFDNLNEHILDSECKQHGSDL